MDQPTLSSRRAFLKSAPIAAAAVVLGGAPAIATAAAAADEHPNEKVHRLAREIADALNDERFIGFNRMTITPDWVSSTDNDPDTRIASALQDIKGAFAAQHPDWKFQVHDRSLGVIDGRTHIESEPRRRGILLYASDERYGPEQPRFYVDWQ